MKNTFIYPIYILFFLGFIQLGCSEDDMQDEFIAEEISIPAEEENTEEESPAEDGESTVDDAEEETAQEEEESSETEEEPASGEDPAEEEPATEDPSAEDPPANEEENTEGSNTNCGPADFVFNESGGLIAAEFEKAAFNGPWNQASSSSGFTGDGYLVWTGNQYFGNPGNGIIRLKLRINSPGTYEFTWRTAVIIGNNPTEHNDTWLRFPDADDFFGEKNGNIIYPKGIGKSPNPEGASADGWFKVYRSGGNLSFQWEAYTSDFDGHKIFVKFNSPGEYTMEVSARSTGHAIDKFLLFKGMTVNQAINASNNLSEISCSN